MRMKEHEKEASDLIQKTKLDKKTIADLRAVSNTVHNTSTQCGYIQGYESTIPLFLQELVQEKIKSQQLSNELEQLKAELHKMGYAKEKLQANALAADEEYVSQALFSAILMLSSLMCLWRLYAMTAA